jgi:hypothetical protein
MINFKEFLNLSETSENKENFNMINISKQGMQGACMNETCELTDDEFKCNIADEKEIKYFKAQSVLNCDYEFEQENVTINNELLLENIQLNNTLSS